MRIAVITGAAQGIGRRTAELFAAQGYGLALIDLRGSAETTAAVAPHNTPVLDHAADISGECSVQAFVAAVKAKFGRVDVLVNNAGISFIAPAETVTVSDFRRVLDVNLVAPFLLAREFGAMMLEARAGSIVNVASIAGLYGVGDRSAYNASKHGLIGLTRTLAAEWGGRGVRVNAVCPGWVKTEMDAADQASSGYTDQDIQDRVPMGRFATPEEIARAILFLADPVQSSFVNGQSIAVDGGWTTDASWQSLRLSHR